MEDSNESVLTEKENLMENMLENSLLKSSVIEYQTSKNDKKNLFSFSDE